MIEKFSKRPALVGSPSVYKFRVLPSPSRESNLRLCAVYRIKRLVQEKSHSP